MLKKFTVSNYRVFENPITIDFTNVRDYKFNEECIRNGLINKAIIYGGNAVGKTSLREAILDVTMMIPAVLSNGISLKLALAKNAGFLNAKSNKEVARFEYIFQIAGSEIEYVYEKSSVNKIHLESLKVDGKLIYELNFEIGKGDFSEFQNYPELALLNIDSWNDDISVLKYILSHTKLEKFTILKELHIFIEGMFNSEVMLGEVSVEIFTSYIIEKNLASDFEKFLKEAGVDVSLKIDTTLQGEKELFFDYGKGNKLLKFLDYASSGTLSLVGLYFSKLLNPTFIYIDEFDANFHFGISKVMLEKLKENTDCQTIITTHNTDLMSNKYMRPDCYLLMSKNGILNLADATKRELRQGHNLENLYQAGEFNELISRIGVKDE